MRAIKTWVLRTIAHHLARPRVLAWLRRRAVPYFNIHGTDGRLYMRRWWLLPKCCLRFDSVRGYPMPAPWMPFSIRLHHIVRPDADRHLHDHPFNFRTFVLQGWYEEEVPGHGPAAGQHITRYMLQGTTAAAPATRWHRIADVSEGGVWTLFVMGRRINGWGFLVDGKKVPWREYLSGREGAA